MLPSCTTVLYDRHWCTCSSQGIQPAAGAIRFQKAATLVESAPRLHLEQEKLKFLSRPMWITEFGVWEEGSGQYQEDVHVCALGKKVKKFLNQNPPFLVTSCACILNATFALSFFILSDLVLLLGQQEMAAVEYITWLGDSYSLPELEGSGKGRSSSTSEQQNCLIQNLSPS